MAYGTRVRFEPLREIEFGDVGAAYVALGTPLVDHTRVIMLTNAMDQDVYISFDGVINHIRLAVNSFQLFDLSANKIRDDGLFIASGTQMYVKEVSASVSSGSIWVESMSAEGGK